MRESNEHLYMPSLWTKRMASDDVVGEHIRVTTAESLASRENVNFVTHAYGTGSPNKKVDIFGLDIVPADAPLLVYFSGGYWQELSGKISAYVVRPQVKAGILTAIVDYDRAPMASVSEIVEQAIEATQWLVEFVLRSKTRRAIVLAGHSAGSQLCAMVLSSQWFGTLAKTSRELFGAVVHLSGVFDLKPLVGTSVNDVLKMDVENATTNSPMQRVDKLAENLPKNFATVVVVGENDSPAFKSQARDYAEKISGFSQASYVTIQECDHFDLVEKLAESDYELTKTIVNVCHEAAKNVS